MAVISYSEMDDIEASGVPYSVENVPAESEDFWQEHCSVIPPEPLRLILVALIGTTVALISFIFNLFLFLVLVVKKKNRKTHLLYLIILALIDVFLSASYILLFPTNLFMDYFESEILALIWWFCLRTVLALCHIAISASALLLTAATFERFLTISRYRTQFSTKSRVILSSVCVLFALAAKGPMFFELKVVPNENCTGVTKYRPEMQDWAFEEPYKTVYKFWFRSIVNTFLPFFLGLYFNIRIVSRLNQQHSAARLFRFATSEHRKNIRSATRMLVLVACCYLACNLLNVIVTAWEFIDMTSLMTPELRPFYTYSSDLVSLLTVFASAVRLPIYYACNARIRREVNMHLLLICCESTLRKFSRDSASLATIRYLNTGNGFVMYSSTRSGRSADPKFLVVGTGFDKVVLQVAMKGWSRAKFRSSFRRNDSKNML
ncbi:7 transmembrane receptor (rhodopsin family) domain-containing protein [Ditylenchus destructor]|nr:7 transmembrane receptor (rhodopsin family) domain-containing protein [Ditylenchus destructor]